MFQVGDSDMGAAYGIENMEWQFNHFVSALKQDIHGLLESFHDQRKSLIQLASNLVWMALYSAKILEKICSHDVELRLGHDVHFEAFFWTDVLPKTVKKERKVTYSERHAFLQVQMILVTKGLRKHTP